MEEFDSTQNEIVMVQAFETDWHIRWQRVLPLQSLMDEVVAASRQDLVALRRQLHAHPEASGEEFETTQLLVDRLRSAGMDPRVPTQGVGVIADLDLGTPRDTSPRIAVRADIDALRLTDRKTVPYASARPGLMHACGHDCHTAMVLMAACGLAGLADHPRWATAADGIGGLRLRFLFQPAEESAQGAQWLVDNGAMDQVDAILGVHVDPQYPVGIVGIRAGVLTAHCDEVTIRMEGRGGHAARPHHTTDPIAAAAQLVTLLHQNLPRAVDSRSPSVFTIGRIHAGEASNVIPDHVDLSGSLRTIDASVREIMISKVRDLCHAVEVATGNHVTVGFHNALGAVVNDPQIIAAFEAVAERLVGQEGIRHLDVPSMGGEDFSVYLQRARGRKFDSAARGRTPNGLRSTRLGSMWTSKSLSWACP